MSAQAMRTEELQAGQAELAAGQRERAPRALRIIALTAVCLGVAALAAATFVLSYSAIRAVALQAGITPRLARGYPLLVDAMLVTVLAAVLALRGAGLPSRLLAWLTLLAVLAAAAGAGALHAAGRTLPHQQAAITAAVLPWALVFIAFTLLLAMLRHARLRRAAAASGQVTPYGQARGTWQAVQDDYAYGTAAMPALELPVRQPPAEPGFGGISLLAHAEPALEEPELDEPEIDGSELDEPAADEAEIEEAEIEEAALEPRLALDEPSAAEQTTEPAQPDDPDMPVFHRMWSAPTPPARDISSS
jgi:hypothetical protein